MMTFSDLTIVTGTRSEYNMCLWKSMGMSKGGPEIWLLGGISHMKAKSLVTQHLQGGQEQVSEPQLPQEDHVTILES